MNGCALWCGIVTGLAAFEVWRTQCGILTPREGALISVGETQGLLKLGL